MKFIKDVVIVAVFAMASLMIFHLIPNLFGGGNREAIFEYSLVATLTLVVIAIYGRGALSYFRLPRFSFASGVAIIVAATYAAGQTTVEHPVHLSLGGKVEGLIYLFAIGFGEELAARGFIFDVFNKYGKKVAVVGSALVFALMHLNLFLGKYWNPKLAYYEILNTFSFGILAAAVLLATRSIWVPIVMHAVCDWSVVFNKNAPDDYIPKVKPFDPFWTTVKYSFETVQYPLGFALLIFISMWVSKHKFYPTFIERLLVKWKLVEVDQPSEPAEITHQP
jgi:membrane protease YdiL (CAAX protease family)